MITYYFVAVYLFMFLYAVLAPSNNGLQTYAGALASQEAFFKTPHTKKMAHVELRYGCCIGHR